MMFSISQGDFNTALNLFMIIGGIAAFYYVRHRFNEQENNTKHVLQIAKLHGRASECVNSQTVGLMQVVEEKVKVVEERAKVVEGKVEEVKQVAEVLKVNPDSSLGLTLPNPKPKLA